MSSVMILPAGITTSAPAGGSVPPQVEGLDHASEPSANATLLTPGARAGVLAATSVAGKVAAAGGLGVWVRPDGVGGVDFDRAGVGERDGVVADGDCRGRCQSGGVAVVLALLPRHHTM